MIEVKNITKSFNGEEILKGITTVFSNGQTNLIIGQSGAGKTVFLKCLLGLFRPDSGKILYDGAAFSSFSDEEQRELRQQIGMVFQGGALFDSMTVEENVMFPLRMFTRQKRHVMLKRVKEVLDRVNLAEAQHKKFPVEVSGGMQKRVSIARAIVNHPKYLFLSLIHI